MRLRADVRAIVTALFLVVLLSVTIEVPSPVVTAASPLGTNSGGVALFPPVGDSGTTFALGFAQGVSDRSCPGDVFAGYRWSTFITPYAAPGAVSFRPSGTAFGPGFTTNLTDAASFRIRNVNPQIGTALIDLPANVTFSSTLYDSMPAGEYLIGVACTVQNAVGDVDTIEYWASRLTVSTVPGAGPHDFTYQLGEAVILDINVVRPVGSLVLTQVCRSHAAVAAEPATFGFPNGAPVAPAVNASTVGSPTATGLAPTRTEDGVRPGDSDPNSGEYPYPVDDLNLIPNATYRTHCGIDLGNARLVTRGAAAGAFFASTGVIDQITIVDTRDDDGGWTASGLMGTFSTSGGTDTFSGSQLGWNPVASDATDPWTDSNGVTYAPQPRAGPVVAPNSPNSVGLGNGGVLLSAPAGHGLGVAIADARLKLLIPVTADAGSYSGTLTITVV